MPSTSTCRFVNSLDSDAFYHANSLRPIAFFHGNREFLRPKGTASLVVPFKNVAADGMHFAP
jgi:hypothetical protein